MKVQPVLCFLIFLLLCLISCQIPKQHPDHHLIIDNGQALQVLSKEQKWQQKDRFLLSGDPFDELYAMTYLEKGDFELNAQLSLERIDSSTALFLFFGHHFGFDSSPDEEDKGGRLFFYNPGTKELRKLAPARQHIVPGTPFQFNLKREGGQFSFHINEELVAQMDSSEFVLPLEGYFAFRPGENVMRLYHWEISGTTRSLPPLDFLFTAGEAGYICFRIPAIIKTKQGELLAFAEARKDNCWTDGRDIDIVLKRSEDGGKTWGPLEVIWDDGANTCAYPTPVIDDSTGTIFLMACHNLGVDLVYDVISGKSQGRRSVFVMQSQDGKKWSKPKDITEAVMLDSWSWYGMASGAGIQLQSGPNKGRLIIPAHHREMDSKKLFAHAVFSDDYGKNWELGQPTVTEGGNECQIVEVEDGRLLMNMRNYNKEAPNQRQIAISYDGGESWTPSWFDTSLVDPPCQASMIMVRKEEATKGILLFANPPYVHKRADLTLRASLDEGKTWPFEKKLFDGATAYSDLVQLGPDTIGILYERGHPFPYQGLTFEVIALQEWLNNLSSALAN